MHKIIMNLLTATCFVFVSLSGQAKKLLDSVSDETLWSIITIENHKRAFTDCPYASCFCSDRGACTGNENYDSEMLKAMFDYVKALEESITRDPMNKNGHGEAVWFYEKMTAESYSLNSRFAYLAMSELMKKIVSEKFIKQRHENFLRKRAEVLAAEAEFLRNHGPRAKGEYYKIAKSITTIGSDHYYTLYDLEVARDEPVTDQQREEL